MVRELLGAGVWEFGSIALALINALCMKGEFSYKIGCGTCFGLTRGPNIRKNVGAKNASVQVPCRRVRLAVHKESNRAGLVDCEIDQHCIRADGTDGTSGGLCRWSLVKLCIVSEDKLLMTWR